jgi:multiple sugar transport system permease protein
MTLTPLQRIAIYAALVLAAAAYLLPLVYMLNISLKPTGEVLSENPSFFPKQPDLRAYQKVLGLDEPPPPTDFAAAPPPAAGERPFDFPLYARNTLLIFALSLPGVLLSSAIAAYGFARIPFRGRGLMFAVCLATMMIPFPVIMVPTYMLFAKLGWIGTFRPLWVPAWFASAFNVFLLRQFFLGIPKDLEESAMLDGCSRWGCFWRIMLPLAQPALAVVALFHCLTVWNDFVGPLIYLSHQEQFTLALGLQSLQARSGDTPWNELMAASTLIVIPVIVLFLVAQRKFIQGIATTGLKG